MFVDTHAHLDFKDFSNDLAKTLAEAKASNVGRIINVGASMAGSRDSVGLAATYKDIYATVGIHPHDAAEATHTNLDELVKLSGHKKVVAIGEIGLDYFKATTSPVLQKEAFMRQLQIASDLKLPVILHTRDAEHDILDCLRRYKGLPGVVHFFSGSPEFAEAVIEFGLYVSFTGVITYKARKPGSGSGADYDALRATIIKSIPAKRLMIETDCPFAAPEPYRGKRNEPAYVVEIAKKIADIRGVSLEEIERTTTENAARFFGLD